MEKNNDNIKFISILLGISIILLFLGTFLNSKFPLDLMFITVGLMVVIIGFYIHGEKINKTVTYFLAMSWVNIFQWLIVFYILLNSQIHLTADVLIVLAIAPVMTLSLISQIRRSDLKHIGNRHKTNMDVILVDNMRIILDDKGKAIYISAGFMIMIVCLTSFLFSRSPTELFGSSIGIMAIVYGYFRESRKNNLTPPDYTPGMSHNKYYREVKKVKVTVTYAKIMACIIIFQWLIMCYIGFIYQYYVPYEVYYSECMCIPYTLTFTFFATQLFYIQLRESDLKYIGKDRIRSKTKKTKDNGYFICDKCNRYYELRSDESPEDLVDSCECGGKLEHHYRIWDQS
jgi:hypothetical protein